jgi:hypothetical protein
MFRKLPCERIWKRGYEVQKLVLTWCTTDAWFEVFGLNIPKSLYLFWVCTSTNTALSSDLQALSGPMSSAHDDGNHKAVGNLVLHKSQRLWYIMYYSWPILGARSFETIYDRELKYMEGKYLKDTMIPNHFLKIWLLFQTWRWNGSWN